MFHPARGLTLGLQLFTAGCGAALSPEAQCFAEATIAYRAAWRGAQAIRADLARGYGLQVQEIGTTRAVPCRAASVRGLCLANARERITFPVPIDRAALSSRLAALEAKMDALRPAAMAAAAPCGDRTGRNGAAAP